VGVDVGGTFTDAVAYDPGSGRLWRAKVLTRRGEPWRGVLEALGALGVEPAGIGELVHATTLGTNMLLGQVGLEPAEAWLVTSRGAGDVVEIGRQNRPDIYDPLSRRAPPLVPPGRRLEVGARLGPGGEALEEPGPGELEAVAERIRAGWGRARPLAVVVSVLHCYRRPGFEEELAGRLRGLLPEAAVVETGCGVDPSPGEYERTSTALVNAVLKPVFGGYVGRLRGVLGDAGFRGRLLVMQSSGGLAPPGVAERLPALFIESGPAAGAVAAGWLSRLLGVETAVGFDMGGTTAKAVLIRGGRPGMSTLFEVGGRWHQGRLVRGTGYPVRAPHVDLVEVSAGGGTIAWVDEGGGLRVGPLSAGADPGPACYGRGGRDPTVTDAHLVLGRLPAALAGGLLRLDRGAAEAAYRGLAERLGTGPWEAAAAVLEQATAEMARAVRLVTVERGVEPGEAALVAYGGAGPLHAAELAEEAGIERVLVPPAPGVFSALGLLAAGQRLDVYRGVHRRLDELDPDALREAMRDALGEALELLPGAAAEAYIELGYMGQEERLELPLEGSPRELAARFRESYRRRHGWLPPREPPIVAHRVHVVAYTEPPAGLERAVEGLRAVCSAPAGSRRTYFLGHGWAEASVYHGCAPREARGPLLVEEEDSTLVVPPGWRLALGPARVIMLERM